MEVRRKRILKLKPIYTALQRYIVLWGGRGGGKSFEVARCIIIRLIQSDRPLRVLCCREIQKSIKESVHALLVAVIYDLNVQAYFDITNNAIKTKKRYNGKHPSEIFFEGLHNNIYEIKSLAFINLCWVEEAGNVSQESWDILLPTIREECSQVIITFNPTEETAPTYQMFVIADMPEEERLLINVNFWDNPYMSQTLYREMERMKRTDYERYLHYWEGKPLRLSNAAIFKDKFVVRPIEITSLCNIDYIDNMRIDYHYGMDFGFSTDPFACLETFIHKGKIYITKELYHHGLENTDIVPSLKLIMPDMVDKRRKVYADGSSPSTISQLAKPQLHPSGYKIESLNIMPAVKGAGSVEEGINWLRSFTEIVVSPECTNTIWELNNYKYVVDKVTGVIIPKPEDKNNHACITGDTLIHTEYGLEPIRDLMYTIGKAWSYNIQTNKRELNYYGNVTITNNHAQIYEILLIDGRTIKATADHPILTDKGWKPVIELTEDDSIIQINCPNAMGYGKVRLWGELWKIIKRLTVRNSG